MTEQTAEPSPVETAEMIASTLGETGEEQRKQIQHIVWALGRTQARDLLQRTLDIEQSGGMMLPDHSRRRTPGGIFFHLVYSEGKPKQGRRLTRLQWKSPSPPKPAAPVT